MTAITRRMALGMGVGATALVVTGCTRAADKTLPPEPSPVPGFRARVDTCVREVIAEMAEASPVFATSIGLHDHDHRWPDLSPGAIEARAKAVEAAIVRIEALSREEAEGPERSAGARVDLDILATRLRAEQFETDTERPWQRNPLAWVGTIGSGLDLLIMRPTQSAEARARALVGRLSALPAFVDQAIGQLSQPSALSEPHTRVAAGQAAGLRDLIAREMPARLAGISAALAAELSALSEPALAAIGRLQAHAQAAIDRPQPTWGPWRAGRDAFARKLQLTLETPIEADELLSRALAEHDRVVSEMERLAGDLYPALFGYAEYKRRSMGGGGKGGNATGGKGKAGQGSAETLVLAGGGKPIEVWRIRDVLAELALAHPSAEGLRDAAEENLVRLQRFVEDARIVPTDPRERLEVIWTPPHQRGVAIAGLDAPPPLDAAEPGLPSFYLVQPLPDDWDATRRASFLREYNTFMLEILSIHEAIPGHFVQLYYGKREPSWVRKIFSNGAFVEGWAVYTERVMMEAGYAGAGPGEGASRPAGMSEGLWEVLRNKDLRHRAIALHAAKFYLRTVTNAILDHRIHVGEMNEAQAVEFMVERSFQQEGEARAKWRRAQLSFTQLSTYFVGATAWWDLRRVAESRADFDLQAFHAAALSHGAPPVHRLPELMGWR